MKLIKALLATAALLVAPFTHAAFVTLPSLDAIFSQASFGNNTIQVRYGAVTSIARPDLLDIQTDAQIDTLFALHVGAQNIVNFYFVDTIDSCSGFNVLIIGCGETPGQDFVVESAFAATAQGALLLAHELGHNLGLNHNVGSQFLMNPSLAGGSLLTASEVTTILASQLVQMDTSGQRFININPVLITAAAVIPEPGSLLLLVSALAAMTVATRRRQQLQS